MRPMCTTRITYIRCTSSNCGSPGGGRIGGFGDGTGRRALRLCYGYRTDMRQSDQERDQEGHDERRPRQRTRLVASSAALVVLPIAALAVAGTVDTDRLPDGFAATQVSTVAPTTTSTIVLGREAVPAPQNYADPKGVEVVATTTTTTAPPTTTTTAPPAPEPAPEPDPAPEPEVAAAPEPTRAEAPAPATAPAPSPPPPAPGSVSANLDAIAQCESGGDPDAYNPAGYYGAFQFALSTWWSVGMTGDPRDYTYNQQKFAAIALFNRSGYSPWPACAAGLGLL